MDVVASISQYMQGPQAYLVLACVMFLCGVGVPLQADTMLLITGVLCASGHLDSISASLVSIVFMFCGDAVVYTLGRRYGENVFGVWPLRILATPIRVERARMAVAKFGPPALILCRFVPGSRTLTVATTGVFQLSWKQFGKMNVLGISLVVPSWIFIGRFLSGELEDKIQYMRYPMIAVVAALLVVGVYRWIVLSKRV